VFNIAQHRAYNDPQIATAKCSIDLEPHPHSGLRTRTKITNSMKMCLTTINAEQRTMSERLNCYATDSKSNIDRSSFNMRRFEQCESSAVSDTSRISSHTSMDTSGRYFRILTSALRSRRTRTCTCTDRKLRHTRNHGCSVVVDRHLPQLKIYKEITNMNNIW
jgi:hypothetical protein